MSRAYTWVWMVPLLAGLALIQSVVGPRIALATVHPDLVLIFLVGWTLLYGARESVVWAFVGGLWLDLLSGGAMGASSLALMAAVLVAGLGGTLFFHRNIFVPALTVAASTFVYAGVHLAVLALLQDAFPVLPALERIVMPSLLYNSGLAMLLTPLLNRAPEIQEVV